MRFYLAKRVVAALLVAAVLIAAQSATGLSLNVISNGCSAYGCKRTCLSNSYVIETPGDNGFQFQIDSMHGNNNNDDDGNKYMPEKTYKVTLVGSRNPNSNTYTEFRGFLVVSVPETWYDAMPFSPVGRFKVAPDDRQVKYASGCSEMITHTHFETKTSVSFYWTAPKAGSGCIALKAHVFQTETVWFKDDGQLSKILCESDMADEKMMIPKCCACGEAKYALTFKGLWSKETHPKDWPTNEGLLHFSNLIGASHSRNFTVWDFGGMASLGLKELAEYGIIRTMEQELKNQSQGGQIRNILTANGLWFPNLNKETSTSFVVSTSHHLLSFATMLGPSPDWLTGLSKFDMCLPDCTWMESHEEDLFPFDAGTDSGISYNSPNKPTVPQEKIRKITSSYPNNIKAPFYDPSGKEMLPVAKLTLRKVMTRGAQCPNGRREPEPREIDSILFDRNDYSDALRRNQLLAQEQSVAKKSRARSKEMKFIEQVDPRCMTTDWSEWSPCSSSCGNGLRKRSRQYKDPKSAMMASCTEIIEDQEMCLSENGECESDGIENQNEISDMCLMLTQWSSFSPCSTTCGKGFTVRVRNYLKPELKYQCNAKLEERKSCVINEKCLDESLMSNTERKRICMLDKKPGPCRMTVNNTRYYFDRQMKKCLAFEYGGCRGNENNFDSVQKCQSVCNKMNENIVEEEPRVRANNDREMEAKKQICMMAREEGTCYESQIRYYFDRTKLMCVPFEFSGCGGNANNFATLSQCESACHFMKDSMKMDDQSSMKHMDLTIPEKKKICMSPAEKGTCSGSTQRYAYNVNMAKCLLFEYSGCEGNLNNFETIEQCESTCDILIQMSQQSAASDELADLENQKKEMCMEPMEPGPCADNIERYYFDEDMGKCMSFKFGGCHGNRNNFESREECETTCHSLIESAVSAKPKEIDMEPKQMSFQERKTVCKMPLSEGSCKGRFKRYHFNFFTQSCDPFIYSGCEGNENNFLTMNECYRFCSDLTMNYTAEAIKMVKRPQDVGSMYPVNCLVSGWTNWTSCSTNECGKRGTATRTRKILVESKYGGLECPKNLVETKSCFKKCSTRSSENDCIVGPWSSWTECQPGKSCMEGYQERERHVIRYAINDGKDCPKLREKRMCYLGPDACKKRA